MLTIGSEGTIHLQGECVFIQEEDMTSFLMANMAGPCDISGAKVKDVLLIFQHLNSFIQEYFLEDFHVLDILVRNYMDRVEELDLYKEMVIDGSGYVHIIPRASIKKNETAGVFIESPIALIEKMEFNDLMGVLPNAELNAKFTLLDIMECFFTDLSHTLTQGS